MSKRRPLSNRCEHTILTVGDIFPEAKLIPAAGIWRLSAGGSGPEQTTCPRRPS